MASPSLYFHTVRHLRLQQIYRRLWFRWIRPRVDESPRPPLRASKGNWVDVARRRPSLVNATTFSFFNVQGRLEDIGWDDPPHEKLWRYNQHYFDDLNAVGSAGRAAWHRDLLTRWLAANPPPEGTGWEPYPTSLRIVNWVKWHLSSNVLPTQALQSLAVQARWLSKRLEWHLLGNHLFANAKALVFAGLFFDGDEAARLVRLGVDVIDRQLPEQVLPDGGHFERSPMYHALFLEDLLDLVNLAQAYPGVIGAERLSTWRKCASKMQAWLKAMCHPDGEIAFFNDAAIGIAPSPFEIDHYAQRLGISANDAAAATGRVPGIRHFADTGYIRLADSEDLDASKAALMLDVAQIGPDYLPGHAHADTLAFELSLFGQRLIVNGGTSKYGSDTLRLHERGTAAHSTVEIDGQDSSEVWSGFRVARRAYPRELSLRQGGGMVSVTCSHDGYRRLPGRPTHTRQWQFGPGVLRVQDRVEGHCTRAVARFHLHPDVQVEPTSPGEWTLRLPSSDAKIHLRVMAGEAQLENGFYAPEFGIRIPNRVVAVRFGGKACQPEAEIDLAHVEISWRLNH